MHSPAPSVSSGLECVLASGYNASAAVGQEIQATMGGQNVGLGTPGSMSGAKEPGLPPLVVFGLVTMGMAIVYLISRLRVLDNRLTRLRTSVDEQKGKQEDLVATVNNCFDAKFATMLDAMNGGEERTPSPRDGCSSDASDSFERRSAAPSPIRRENSGVNFQEGSPTDDTPNPKNVDGGVSADQTPEPPKLEMPDGSLI